MNNLIKMILRKYRKSIRYIQKFGLISGTNVIISLFKASFNTGSITLSLPGLRNAIKMRSHTSDFLVFNQIFLDGNYDLPIRLKPKLIIDGGAYIGLSTIFFANKFPDAKIIAVEPNSSNFTLLKENTVNYPNIKLINSGIWNKKALLKIRNASRSHWETEVEETPNIQEESFEAVTMGELLICSGFKEIDILKLDVEGSEKIIFSSGCEGWLDKVNIIIIELHDRFQPGCSETVYAALKPYNFIKYDKGENTIFIKNNMNDIDYNFSNLKYFS